MSDPFDVGAYRAPIEAALEYTGGTHNFEDVVEAVHAGRMQFWPGPSSAIVTEINEYPRFKALNFFLAGGDLGEIERMTPGVLEWGRQRGCTRATFLGRKGWARTFATRTGWQVDNRMAMFERAL